MKKYPTLLKFILFLITISATCYSNSPNDRIGTQSSCDTILNTCITEANIKKSNCWDKENSAARATNEKYSTEAQQACLAANETEVAECHLNREKCDDRNEQDGKH